MMEGEAKAEVVDSALLSALSHPRNREIVLDFECRVLAFLEADEEALIFPLTLSGYQRLLAHRTAQHHGLQTETIADDSEDHGKIRATRPESSLEGCKDKLADVPVAAAATEDQREAPPKALKKNSKTGPDRPRPHENHLSELRGSQERPYKPFVERTQSYEKERVRIFENVGERQHHEPMRSAHSLRNGSDGGSSEVGKAQMRNRAEEIRDPEFQRYRHVPGGMMDPRFRPGMHGGEEMDQMTHMMQGLSFAPGPDHPGFPYAQHPNAMAVGSPYTPMPVHPIGYGYQAHVMQQIPQNMGLYGSAGMPYGYGPQMPPSQYAQAPYPQQFMQPYPYPMHMRPANGVMPPFSGQQMAPNMVPYYQQQFVQQGYQMPAPGPHGGRPGFPGPRSQVFLPQHRPVPSNGSGGYNRKPNTAHRPMKSEVNAAAKTSREVDPAAVSAPPTAPPAAATVAEALPPAKAPEADPAPADTPAEPAAKAGDKDQA